MLAIGTTLRAGGGDERAFSDQRDIMKGWDEQRKEAEDKADQVAANLAFNEAMVTDEKTGQQKFDQQKFLEARKKYNVKSDTATAPGDPKESRTAPAFQSKVAIRQVDENGNVKVVERLPYSIDPKDINLFPKTTVGAPAAAPASQGVPPPPAPPTAQRK